MRLIASTRIRKAYKQHSCHLCRLPICVGDEYVLDTYAPDGIDGIYTLATHVECDEECAAIVQRSAGEFEEGFEEGALADDLREAEPNQVTGLEWQRWYRGRLAASVKEG